MHVRILFFGILKDIMGTASEMLDIAPGSTVADVFERLCERSVTLRERAPSILLATNGEFSKPDVRLVDGDEVALLPPVSGGSDGDPGPTNLTRESIDSRALARQVQSGQDGAVVVFEGVVRNNTGGRETLFLDYEGYEPLARKQLALIANEIRQQTGITAIAMVHRLGRLEIGEVSVAIAVSAPHRKAAFQAASDAIDQVKLRVPIWKKEHFADGSEWVQGEWADALKGG